MVSKRYLFVITSLFFAFTKSTFSLSLYVYNPESLSSTNSLGAQKSFKETCSAVLGSTCEVQFFAKSVDFDNAVKSKMPDIMVVASYYYKVKKVELSIEAFLSGMNQKASGFRKNFVVPINLVSVADIDYLSAVSIGARQINPLEQGFINQIGASQCVITPVSKELDALMALAFGQVTAAIATDEAMALMYALNPNTNGKFRIFKKLPAIPYAKVTVSKKQRQQTKSNGRF